MGKIYEDGSFDTIMAGFNLKNALTRDQLQRILDGSGIEAFTVADKTLTTYYAGNPNDSQAIQQFEDSVEEADKLIGSDANTVDTTVERFWAYGSGSGVTNSYGSIRSKLHPTKADPANPIAQRIASWLSGRDVQLFYCGFNIHQHPHLPNPSVWRPPE